MEVLKEYSNYDFEKIRHFDEDGVEFWYARELMVILEYNNWDEFSKIIKRAIKTCRIIGANTFEHFTEVGKSCKIDENIEIYVEDYKLTRYGCYIVAQNGARRRRVILFARGYFAV